MSSGYAAVPARVLSRDLPSIIIEHFLLANASQAQTGRFENARCLNRDGMAEAEAEVIETYYATREWHDRQFIISVVSSPAEP